MTSLRCVEGLSLEKVEQQFGAKERERLEREAKISGLDSLLVNDKGALKIPPEKMLLSDMAIEALMQL
jgi:coproporphyrinogen III oxidase-like Fe-S oxidoreductase